VKELQRRREQAGWSRAELGRRSSINPSTISLIESGRLQPYESQLLKLARALKVPARSAVTLIEEARS
jgi:transcriptional regulator with XRE-family HTH domain